MLRLGRPICPEFWLGTESSDLVGARSEPCFFIELMLEYPQSCHVVIRRNPHLYNAARMAARAQLR